MNPTPYSDDWPDIDTALFGRSAKWFGSVKILLGVNINLHVESQIHQGDIFVFNHFSRFETFIPQYLIHETTGAYSCAIAAGEFFRSDTTLSRFLMKAGVFPHDHPRLFPLLAAQVLRGRKVIIFPEGGMVKDRRVVDKRGRYRVFSRISGERRKHHTGAAVLAQGVDAFKAAVRNAYCHQDDERLMQWKELLQLDSFDQLLTAVLKPTLIVPANITFYPIRSSENLLQKGVELFADNVTLRQNEELLIEGNIMLKDTDMDIRMGTPLPTLAPRHWWQRRLLASVTSEIDTLDEIFTLDTSPKGWKHRRLARYFRNNAAVVRDRFMDEIYANVTINLSHLASSLIMHCLGQRQRQIEKARFFTTLYIAVKHLQNRPSIHLHRSLLDPDEYGDLPEGTGRRFEQFICIAKELGLLGENQACYRFLPKLCEDYAFDTIRLDNPIAVYNNEAAPIQPVRETLTAALEECAADDRRCLTAWRFDDERRALAWERKYYSDPRFDDINRLEVADADPSPFFLQPKQPNGCGILLVHGLLAGPAEVLSYGEHLSAQGFTVLGIRIKGHGTSPYALRDQSWEDWYGPVRRGFDILRSLFQRLVVIGFSTGGALTLKLASEQRPELLAVVAVSVPVQFNNPAFMLVPLLYGTNRLIRWASSFEGVKPFIDNAPEHPSINYRNTPVRALFELRRLIQEMDRFLPQVDIPALILYADQDPVVSPKSAPDLVNRLGSTDKRLAMVESARHGILLENIGGTWNIIDNFVGRLRADR